MSEDEMLAMVQMTQMALVLAGGPEKYLERFEMNELVDLFCKFKTNNFNICDEEMIPVGVGVFQLLSFINHSCSPNCVVIFDGPSATIKAIRDIKSGEEICIPYIETITSTSNRRKELNSYFKFFCECDKCKDESFDSIHSILSYTDELSRVDIIEKMNSINGNNKNSSSSSSNNKNNDGEIYLDTLKELEHIFNNIIKTQHTKKLCTYEQVDIYQKLLHVHLSLQDWETCINYLTLIVNTYEELMYNYSKNEVVLWPPLALHYFTLGKLFWFLGDGYNKEAKINLEKAHRTLTKLYPSSTSTRLKELCDLLSQLNQCSF
eukprot:TRINITY_DN1189_c0_g1_i2.p1 TRINITY_DN1189_c0_g1~~TRINITY_DN1189_c0_g1_i2.p1  ORF type:complete len:320 (-),score=48.44 TRINITY_DN1189_c0_g1_i2:38-997(-)